MASIDRFRDGLAEVERLLSLDPTTSAEAEDALTTEEHHDRQASGISVRRAAVVLLVSHFEGYLKQICEDLVDALNEGDIRTRNIPTRVRELHILPRLEQVITAKPGSPDRSSLIKRLSNISTLWNDESRPPKGTLRSEVVMREIHNADSERIDELFAIFGESKKVCDGDIDVKNNIQATEDTHDIRIRLSDLVKCRNDIAHGDLDRKPTTADVQRYVSFLEAFAARLGRKCGEITRTFASIRLESSD